MANIRIDLLLFERGLVESRSHAQRLVMAGQVRLAGQVVEKPSSLVPRDADIQIDWGPRFVSRGGDKLQAALRAFGYDPTGMLVADVGASTGGFTDCLLQHGASKVYAIDVGQGILHWKLRQDPRVVVMEGCNARYLERLPEHVDLVTIDASFISLKVLMPIVKGWFREPSPHDVLVLVKPQFEAGRRQVSRGAGVVRDPQIHRQVLLDVLSFAQSQEFTVRRVQRSPLLGPKGNAEFFAWLDRSTQAQGTLDDIIDVLFL